MRSAASRWRTATQRRSQRFKVERSGRLASGLAIPAWGCTFAVLGHALGPVKQSKVRLLIRQQRQKLTERGKNGEPDAPAIAIAGAEQSGLPYHLRRWSARRQLTVHGLGDDEAEIVGEPIGKPLTPVLDRVGIAEDRPYPDLAACADLDGTGRHVVCP